MGMLVCVACLHHITLPSSVGYRDGGCSHYWVVSLRYKPTEKIRNKVIRTLDVVDFEVEVLDCQLPIQNFSRTRVVEKNEVVMIGVDSERDTA